MPYGRLSPLIPELLVIAAPKRSRAGTGHVLSSRSAGLRVSFRRGNLPHVVIVSPLSES